MTKLPIALQVYSVRDHAQGDLLGILEKIAAMGYSGVEFAGIYDNKAEDVRAKLDELKLEAISMHVPLNLLTDQFDMCVEMLTTLGCSWVAIPWMDTSCLPGGDLWQKTKEDIILTSKKLAKFGITLLYHNHDFEFETHEGEYKLDIMYNTILSETLKTELDTCWIRVGGEDPSEYILKYTGRSPIVHLKDFDRGNGDIFQSFVGEKDNREIKKGRGEDFDFKPVGYGEQNIPPVIKSAEKIGAKWLVVEQDSSSERDTLEAAKMSIEYINNNC